MTTPTVHPHNTVTLDGVGPLQVQDGSVTLDTFGVPYASAVVVLPLTASTALDDLDPRDDTRVIIHGTATGQWQDPPPTYTPWVETRRNYIANPGLEAGTAPWAGNAATVSRDTTDGWGLASLKVVTNGTDGSGVYYSPDLLGTWAPGMPVTGRVRVKATAGALYWVQLVVIGGSMFAVIPMTGDGQWQDITFPGGTFPAGATSAPYFYIHGTGTHTPFTFWVDNALVERASAVGAYFDGSTPDAELTRYEWTGAADASPSVEETRTRLPDAPPVWLPDAARPFDLGLRERTVDHAAKTVALTLASDEALLMDYAPLTVDTGAWPLQASLRGIVNYVLGKVIPGATLAATPAVDADVTAYWEVTNLIPNPAVRNALGNWIAGGANATVARETGHLEDPATPELSAIPGLPGVTTATLTTWSGNSGLGSGGINANTATTVPYATVSPFTTYTVSCVVRSGAKRVDLKVQVFGEDGQMLESGRTVKTVDLVAGVWTAITATFTTGANAARVNPFVTADESTQWVAGEGLRASGWMLYEGTRTVPFFDAYTLEDVNYRYVSSGPGGASASIREPKNPRDPDMFTWPPGVTAWDFLEPLLTSVGLRLFCDERRVWRLVDPTDYALPGYVTVHPGNLTDGVDTVTRDDEEVWCTGVLIRYLWDDSHGITQVQYDSAGTPEKVAVLEYARPYPGPGAAAAILARRDGTGRAQDVTGLIRWEATPTMAAEIQLPLALDQLGKIAAVWFSLADDALMTLTTRTLIDRVPGSWLDIDPGTRWVDIPLDVSWESWVPLMQEVE